MLKAYAHAKINWALDITGRREDGYHALDMLMQTVEFCDELTFTPAKLLSLTVNGKHAPAGGRNLVLRAAMALKAHTGETAGARISLTKRIPVRAGLGGGSADCAAALRALNELWQLGLPDETLLSIGVKLGADVPYCLTGGLCRVRGIGEDIERMPVAPRALVLLVPVGAGLSTQAVFSEWDARDAAAPARPIDMPRVYEALAEADYERAEALGGNALEAAAERMLPQIARVRARLKQLGARFSRMSGSGSAVYGVFNDERALNNAKSALPGSIETRTLSNLPDND